MIYIINTIIEEKRYFTEKFLGKENLIDIRVRENILELNKTASKMKYYYSINHYKERDREINRNAKIA